MFWIILSTNLACSLEKLAFRRSNAKYCKETGAPQVFLISFARINSLDFPSNKIFIQKSPMECFWNCCKENLLEGVVLLKLL